MVTDFINELDGYCSGDIVESAHGLVKLHRVCWDAPYVGWIVLDQSGAEFKVATPSIGSVEKESPIRKRRRWDRKYIELAKFWAELNSKDPSTKVGAVVVSADSKEEFLGYNGFARGVEDRPERYNDRDTKYAMAVHAEVNAIIKAGHACKGGTLYVWPFLPCSKCASTSIQAGIARVVCPETPEHLKERWSEDFELTRTLYREAGVEVVHYG